MQNSLRDSLLISLKDILLSSARVLVVGHVNPDGDAVGSAFGMAHIVLRLGGDARVLLVSGVPEYLSWLPQPVPVVRSPAELGNWIPDLVVFVDCGDAGRTGCELTKNDPESLWKTPSVNIDHHVSNPGFADINWVEAELSATGELIGLLAEYLHLELDGALGEALYLTLVSDTGDFTHANTSASCLAMAGRILATGMDLPSFTSRYVNSWTLSRMHLWGRLLSEVSLHADGAVACSKVPLAYLRELGLKKEALEGFASWLRRLRGVRVGLFIREDAPGSCKISLRSMGDVNVQAIAALYGGGGHAAAAGAELPLRPEEVAELLVAEIRKHL